VRHLWQEVPVQLQRHGTREARSLSREAKRHKSGSTSLQDLQSKVPKDLARGKFGNVISFSSSTNNTFFHRTNTCDKFIVWLKLPKATLKTLNCFDFPMLFRYKVHEIKIVDHDIERFFYESNLVSFQLS